MRLAYFQVGRGEDGWVVRFEERDYVQPSRTAAISVATKLAGKIGRLGVEAVVFIQPAIGDSWLEWRPSDPLPEPLRQRRAWSVPSRSGDAVPYLRLISSN